MNAWPRNLAAAGLVFDREHLPDSERMAGIVPNRDALALIRGWQRSEEFRFLVIGGPLHKRRHVIGGMACDLAGAMRLFRIVCQHFDRMAANRRSFTSAWFLVASEPTQAAFREAGAAMQAVEGSA
jgi:hypothetical protein